MKTPTLTVAIFFAAVRLYADPLSCDLSAWKAQPGLAASVAENTLTVTWDGAASQEMRLRFALEGGVPVIRELAVRRKGGQWAALATNVVPIFDIVSGQRRMSQQQMEPLESMGVRITPEIIDARKWDAFWDAPLDIPGTPASGRGGNFPRDLPRAASEIHRASAAYKVNGCTVASNGARVEVSFPGVELGVFSGKLQYTVYKGTNLIRQEIVAKTDQNSVAYKYDSGLKGLAVPGSRVAWRDLAGNWQENRLGGNKNDAQVVLKVSNRYLAAEGRNGSIAVFPPPHTFFWAREVETNLGYHWFRKESGDSFSLGIRQAEKEEAEEYAGNFALYSAPPGSLQRMAMYIYANAGNAASTYESVMAFTHGDRFKALTGYQVMAHHYHMDLGERLQRAHSLDANIPDLDAIRAAGINIASEISSVFVGRPPGRGGRGGAAPDPLKLLADSYEGAARHSDSNFLVLANQEVYGSPLGGHTDLLFSHPVYWSEKRAGQEFVEKDPVRGTVYHISTAEEFIEMARRENILISMPHPRTKGSTGYPDAVKDKDFFNDPHYHGVGFRWGMGLDLSEQRLCEKRCLVLLDDMSNWSANRTEPLKNLLAITETRYKAPGDEVYASSPAAYVKLAALPAPNNPAPVIDALMRGDSWLTSGEVLVPTYSVEGSGAQRTLTAEVEWTFPLEFVEVVYGDGVKTDRKIVSATDLGAFGKHKFQIPFSATGQKWVRFAAWDSAGNGATTQPMRLK